MLTRVLKGRFYIIARSTKSHISISCFVKFSPLNINTTNIFSSELQNLCQLANLLLLEVWILVGVSQKGQSTHTKKAQDHSVSKLPISIRAILMGNAIARTCRIIVVATYIKCVV